MSKQRILGDLAHNLDSSAVGSFLAKSSAGGDFKKVSYSLVSGTPSALDSSLSQAIIDSAYIQARQTAPGIAGLDSATMLALIDSSYISGIHGTNTGFDQYYYNATAGQTIFDSDLRGRNLSYEENGVMVFLNGVMLAPSQYTATDGSTVVLDSAASLSDEVTVVKFALGSSGGGGASPVNYGDRAIVWGSNGGDYDGEKIDYFDITTAANASVFGNVHRQVDGFGPGKYNGTCASDITYGVYCGGNSSHNSNNTDQMDYITIATTGNSATFGSLTVKQNSRPAGGSDGTTGYIAGGHNDYSYRWTGVHTFSIATTGNATLSSFVLSIGAGETAGANDATRMVIAGGFTSSNTNDDKIQYLTFASAGTAQSFGDLTAKKGNGAAASNNIKAIIGGGYNAATSSVESASDYITIQTLGNAATFGSLTATGNRVCATGNSTYGVFSGGDSNAKHIDKFVFDTLGNATDHGDLSGGGQAPGCCSGSPS